MMCVLLALVLCEQAGAEIIVEGAFGSGPGEFGIEGEGAPQYDSFPTSFQVTSDGTVVVPDPINGRFQVFGPAGQLLRAVERQDPDAAGAPSDYWPDSLILIGDDRALVRTGGSLDLYLLEGSFVERLPNAPGAIHASPDTPGFFLERDNRWFQYSADLDLIGEPMGARPKELGVQSSLEQVDAQRHVRFEFIDTCFMVGATTLVRGFQRISSSGALYLFTMNELAPLPGSPFPRFHWEVWRNLASGPDSRFVLPATEETEVEGSLLPTRLTEIVEEIGPPRIGRDGSIYYWSRTPTHYRINRLDDPGVVPGPDDAISAVSNDAPVIEPTGPLSVLVGELLAFTVLATDPDPGDRDEVLEFSAENLPQGARFDARTREFSWTPAAEQVGVFSDITFRVRDSACNVTEQTISVTVEEP